MTISHSQKEKEVVFHIVGKLDTITAPTLETYLHEHLKFDTGPVVFDLVALEYIASAGLRLLLLSAKQAKASGQVLQLRRVNTVVLQVLTIAGFTSLFQIHSQHDIETT